MKKTILHFIENLNRGGAETMLVSVSKELKEYNNIVLYLYDENKYESQIECEKIYCLKITSIYQLPFKLLKIRKIIKDNNVDIVHSHLIWPTVAARLATPKSVSLITTIHTPIHMVLGYKKWYIRCIDAYTYRFRKSVIIGVSNLALEKYHSHLKIKPFKNYLLYTFVDINKFICNNLATKNLAKTKYKVFTIGILRNPKNHVFLVKAFEKLKNENIELHIFGDGPQRTELEKLIQQTNADVILKGDVDNIQSQIQDYDIYTMASIFEGFSLSVLEAMAMQMPLLLSDIPSFREQAADAAVYFDLNDIDDFVIKIKNMIANKDLLLKMGVQSNQRVVQNFTLQHHMKGLRNIYSETLSEKIT
jgi:glycosyltransferase involved in cell wall biosynthesis